MGEFNVNKSTGDLIPTAGYGGMIKISGTTLALLASALNNMTNDQCIRCTIEILGENILVLKPYQCFISTEKPAYYNFMRTSAQGYIEVRLDVVTPSYGIYTYDGSSRTYMELGITSWNILYQDDSVSGGNTYPANQVIYNNTTSGLTATDVQGAVDELAVADSTSVSATYFNSNLVFSRVGRIGFFNYGADISNMPAGDLGTIATIPVGYRPLNNFRVMSASKDKYVQLTFSSNGAVTGYNYDSAYSSTTTCRYNITAYPLA